MKDFNGKKLKVGDRVKVIVANGHSLNGTVSSINSNIAYIIGYPLGFDRYRIIKL